MWFERLTGFREESPQQVRDNLTLEGEVLTSRVNGRAFRCGRLETLSLGEFRDRVRKGGAARGKLSVREVVADVKQLHADPANAGALFQVASQFNLLEMVGPSVTPEHGVDRYAGDPTQGPACAIAAGAGTIYRNYFAVVDGQAGQTRELQIDCLADLGAALCNADGRLWEMRNGYALASREGLSEIDRRLAAAGEDERDALRRALRIGVQWDTQVTLDGSTHCVSQAYCSALPVAYAGSPSRLWARFALLVLEASYEATLCAAIANAAVRGDNRVFLTLLGGGVFGNETGWIIRAITRALDVHREVELDVRIVSHRASNRDVAELVRGWG